MKNCIRVFTFLSVLIFAFSLSSCGSGTDALGIVKDVSVNFDFKYGAVYSDEYDVWNEHCFSPDMRKVIFGENAEKYTYIKSVSGYFSRDMVSGEEFIAIEISDRSHRTEISAALYRRAAMKLDTETRVLCRGNFVFFICGEKADEIGEYISRLV